MDNKATGNKGEAIAKELLISKGYRIKSTNWRHSYLEVDIICETEKEIMEYISGFKKSMLARWHKKYKDHSFSVCHKYFVFFGSRRNYEK